jgi:tetratricopeptide (TPR) repeat protein
MKRIMNSLLLVCIYLMVSGSVQAETPRQQLNQMIQQLQQTPNDNALREKIIKLAQELKPAPAIPEEAERHMARGTAAFKGAKSTSDYQDAVREFEQATLAAPWYGDAWYNLGVAQDKAEQYEAALRSLKLARLAAPDAKEIKDLMYEVEYRNDKVKSAPAPAGMVKIPGGKFMSEDRDFKLKEMETNYFFIDKYEVTQAEYKQIMGNNPSSFKGDDLPVETVTWNQANNYCRKVGKRLPTQWEWEKAARGGTSTEYYWGHDYEMAGEYAWIVTNSGGTTHPVGQKKPNAYGLYDMAGGGAIMRTVRARSLRQETIIVGVGPIPGFVVSSDLTLCLLTRLPCTPNERTAKMPRAM